VQWGFARGPLTLYALREVSLPVRYVGRALGWPHAGWIRSH
jgi:hypothetical protein